MLKLRPTDLPSNPADDFEVLDENRTVIGRIMLTRAASRNTPWFWSLFRGHGPQSQTDKGCAATREDAMAALKAAWSQSKDVNRLSARCMEEITYEGQSHQLAWRSLEFPDTY